MNAFAALLKNKWTYITIVVLVLLIMVYANWDKLTGWTKRTYGNFAEPSISPERKAQLEAMARDVYASIEGISWYGVSTPEYITKLNALNDLELEYLAKFYRDAVTRDTKLSDDIDNELIYGDADQQIIARLRGMKL